MTARAGSDDRLDPDLRKLIGILLVGLLAVLLDTTIVNVAIGTLTRELHTTVATVQWVNTGFLLALGIVIPLSVWAVARFGARQMWLVSVALFLIGSTLAGCSWNIGSLIVFRVIQGVGGGLMLPIQQTLLVQAAGRERLGRVMAAISVPTVVVPILGPVIGGLILSDLSWRWIFFINVPISVCALVLAARGLPATRPQGGRSLDVLGFLLLSPGLAILLFGLSEVGAHGSLTGTNVVVPLVLGVVLLAAFTVHGYRISGEPVLDVRLFRDRSFTAAAILLFLSGLTLYGVALLLPLYYQEVRGQSALMAGLLLAPQGIGSLITRGPVGRLADKHGPRLLVAAGVVLASLGTVVYTQVGPHTNEVLLGASLVLRGAGLSGINVAVMVGAFRGLRPEQIPHGSSATRILLQVGGSFGVAVFAVLLQHQLAGHGHDAAAQSAAFATTFWWSLGFTAIAIVPALLLPGRVTRKADEPVAERR